MGNTYYMSYSPPMYSFDIELEKRTLLPDKLKYMLHADILALRWTIHKLEKTDLIRSGALLLPNKVWTHGRRYDEILTYNCVIYDKSVSSQHCIILVSRNNQNAKIPIALYTNNNRNIIEGGIKCAMDSKTNTILR